MSETEYIPPQIWTWDDENCGEWAKINRPIAGATHEKTLPSGQHPLQLYSLATPNGQKVTILLEELLALSINEAEYDAYTIDIGKGEQFGSDFVDVNPKTKIPALVDISAKPSLKTFESGAILQYLAEKFGSFIPKDLEGKTACRNRLFWQMDSPPYLGGGFGHFYAYAPFKNSELNLVIFIFIRLLNLRMQGLKASYRLRQSAVKVNITNAYTSFDWSI